ncbi:hypothetical protein ScPMuIL_018003 [Solemya velum]
MWKPWHDQNHGNWRPYCQITEIGHNSSNCTLWESPTTTSPGRHSKPQAETYRPPSNSYLETNNCKFQLCATND